MIDLPFWMKHRTDPNGIFPAHQTPLVPPGTRIGELVVCNKVPNFFVARTERLRLVDWTPELKRLDHADFLPVLAGFWYQPNLIDFGVFTRRHHSMSNTNAFDWTSQTIVEFSPADTGRSERCARMSFLH